METLVEEFEAKESADSEVEAQNGLGKPHLTSLGLRQDFYPPKYWFDDQPSDQRTHLVFVPRCNFRCQFCYYLDAWKGEPVSRGTFDGFVEVKPYTPDEFRAVVREMIEVSGSHFFKFSGGEPTLIPDLPEYLAAIKDQKGVVYLDTNASRIEKVAGIVSAGLVDGIGVSLQGVTRESSTHMAGIKNARLAWDVPLQTIRLVLQESDSIIVPVTLTVFDDLAWDELSAFADILEDIDQGQRIRLKINNYSPTRSNKNGLVPAGDKLLHELAVRLVDERPHWVGRTTVVMTAKSEGRDNLTQPSIHL